MNGQILIISLIRDYQFDNSFHQYNKETLIKMQLAHHEKLRFLLEINFFVITFPITSNFSLSCALNAAYVNQQTAVLSSQTGCILIQRFTELNENLDQKYSVSVNGGRMVE